MRAQRLLRLVEILRRARVPVTANAIAGELEVTTRTVYRDVAALVSHGTPIRGEAGVGYVLSSGYDVPPLMFDVEELEALMLGARMVVARADAGTARAAENAVAKIVAVVPKASRGWLLNAPLYAPNFAPRREDKVDLSPLREALRGGHKIRIDYHDTKGQPSTRVLWPLSLAFFEAGRGLVAWCELRRDFRHFRTDRIAALEVLEERYPTPRQQLLARWKQQQRTRVGNRPSTNRRNHPHPTTTGNPDRS